MGDAKTLGELFVETPEYRDFAASIAGCTACGHDHEPGSECWTKGCWCGWPSTGGPR